MGNIDRGVGKGVGDDSCKQAQAVRSGMKYLIVLGTVIMTTVALAAAFTMRAIWIRQKISSLSSPPPSVFAEANAKLPRKGPKPRIVLIGDSRIAQWPARVWTGQWEIVNRGVVDETVAQLSKRFQPDAVALQPDVIVIASGINDLVAASFMGDEAMREVTARTAENLRQMAEVGIESRLVRICCDSYSTCQT